MPRDAQGDSILFSVQPASSPDVNLWATNDDLNVFLGRARVNPFSAPVNASGPRDIYEFYVPIFAGAEVNNSLATLDIGYTTGGCALDERALVFANSPTPAPTQAPTVLYPDPRDGGGTGAVTAALVVTAVVLATAAIVASVVAIAHTSTAAVGYTPLPRV